MSQSLNLYRLQLIDTRVDQLKNRLQEIETMLTDHPELVQADEAAKAAEEALKNAQKALHKAEHIVQDQRIKIEQTEAALYGGKVRNPKELQDLQNEAASLKRYLIVLEDHQLEAMLTLEEAEGNHKLANQNLLAVEAKTGELVEQLNDEKITGVKELEKLSLERQAVATNIQAADMVLYEQLRKTRKGLAVTRVVTRSCAACGSTLTPAVAQATQSGNQITRCPSCGRILYPG